MKYGVLLIAVIFMIHMWLYVSPCQASSNIEPRLLDPATEGTAEIPNQATRGNTSGSEICVDGNATYVAVQITQLRDVGWLGIFRAAN